MQDLLCVQLSNVTPPLVYLAGFASSWVTSHEESQESKRSHLSNAKPFNTIFFKMTVASKKKKLKDAACKRKNMICPAASIISLYALEHPLVSEAF